MAEIFAMPKLGMDMEEGVVAQWLKAEGDTVKKGEPLAEIETDKSVVEVEAPQSGVLLKIYLSEGESAPCGDPIAAIGPAGTEVPADPKAAMAAPAPAAAPAAPTAAPAAAPAKVAAAVKTGVAAKTPGGRVRVSPRAARLANQNGVDVSGIIGSGEEGRIVEQDVANYIASGAAAAATTAVAAAPVAQRVPTETVEPINTVRKVTARRMLQSLSEAAQTNHRVDVDTTNLMNFRKQVNAKLEKDGDKYYASVYGAKIALPEDKQAALKAKNVAPQNITLGIRPDHIVLSEGGESAIPATVDVTELMGSTIHMHVNISGKDAIVILPTIDLSTEQKTGFNYGAKVNITFGGNVVHLFSKETEKNLL